MQESSYGRQNESGTTRPMMPRHAGLHGDRPAISDARGLKGFKSGSADALPLSLVVAAAVSKVAGLIGAQSGHVDEAIDESPPDDSSISDSEASRWHSESASSGGLDDSGAAVETAVFRWLSERLQYIRRQLISTMLAACCVRHLAAPAVPIDPWRPSRGFAGGERLTMCSTL